MAASHFQERNFHNLQTKDTKLHKGLHYIDAVCVLLSVAASSFHRRRQSVTVHAALLSLGRQREMRYVHHYATTNSLPCHFVAS